MAAKLFSQAESHRLRGDSNRAIEAYRKALAADPSLIAAHNNAAVLLMQAGRMEEARTHYAAAVRLDASIAVLHYNHAQTLTACGHPSEAIDAYRRAVAVAPGLAQAHINLGILLHASGSLDAAEDHLREAARLAPENALPKVNLGTVLKDQGLPAEGLAACLEAVRLDPGGLMGWSNLFVNAGYVSDTLEADTMAEWLRHYESNVAVDAIAAHGVTRSNGAGTAERPIRVGYVSADFRDHATSFFVEPLLATHDRAQFEVYCYDCSEANDAVTLRLRATAAQWRHCAALNDADLAGLITRDGIDILVDLMGQSAANRLPVFALKPAPVQFTWLGWPASTGLRAIDFAIVDRYIADPPLDPKLYTEALAVLPHTWLCYRPATEAPPVQALPSPPVKFGSFNGIYKLGPAVLDTWAELMKRLPESSLLILGVPQGRARARLRGEFSARGISDNRIQLVEPCSLKDFFERVSTVHVALDPFPFTASTTTLHTLWMGVPVVTLKGASHAARMSNSALLNLGLGEWVASNESEYIDIAAGLALDWNRLTALRSGLRECMRGSPVMDEPGFTRALEAIFRQALTAKAGSSNLEFVNPPTLT